MDGKKLKMHQCKNKSAKTHFGCLFYDKVINAKKKNDIYGVVDENFCCSTSSKYE